MIDVENFDELIRYLRDSGRIASTETPALQFLTGGVSNKTLLVTRSGGESWVVKQALSKLRVQSDWFSSPERIEVEANGQVAIQDVMLVPAVGTSVSAGLAMIYEIYQTAADIIAKRYNARALKADEGGLAPPFSSSAEMLERAAESIETAGYEIGREVSLAIDVAASHFVEADGSYRIDDRVLTADEMISVLDSWRKSFPLVSVEDGLGEDDWDHWPLLCRRLGRETLTLADDLTCTNPGRIEHAIQLGAANALLLKVNQIGTVTEAKNAYLLARQAGWKISVSARSGETEDNWLADLATGWAGDFIKVGSITQSERLAKYNRLLIIEDSGALNAFCSAAFSET